MSRIALRCALATAFTALSGIAVVYSGGREQAPARELAPSTARHLKSRTGPELRSAAVARAPREAEISVRANTASAPSTSAAPSAFTMSAPELIRVSRELPPAGRRGSVVSTTRDAASSASGSSIPLVSIAEALLVRFQGFTDLSGIYRINEDDTIAIPGIGRIELGSLPVEELETMLSKRILGLTGRDGVVSIEVERYRHVFVTGDVDKPGSFNWFRGMTVLKALSIAGGFARQEGREELEDKGDLVSLQLARALSKHSRLAAEMAGKNRVDVPERLIGLCGQYRARELINAEEALLGMRRGSRLASLKAIEAGTTATAAEIARLKELQTSLDNRVDRYADHVNSLDRLLKNNVVTKQRVMDVETTLAELGEKRAGAKVQLARAVAEEVQLIRQRIELEEVYRARLSEEMTETWGKIEELQLDLDKSRPTAGPAQREQVLLEPAVVLKSAGGNGAAPSDAPTTAFVIVRRQGDSEVRIAARDIDALRPGDMVIVGRNAGGSDGASAVRRSCGSGPSSPKQGTRG